MNNMKNILLYIHIYTYTHVHVVSWVLMVQRIQCLF